MAALRAATFLSCSLYYHSLPAGTTYMAFPPHRFVGIWKILLRRQFIFMHIPIQRNIRIFRQQIILRRGRFPGTDGTSAPDHRSAADQSLPGMPLGTLPPHLYTGMICDQCRSELPIFFIIPFSGNMGAKHCKAVLLANTFPHTIRTIPDAAAACTDIHLPAVPLVTFPPNTALAFRRYIMRGKRSIFCSVPLFGQFRKKAGQRILLACEAPTAIWAG